VTEGRGFLTGLEERLQDLKSLYKRKYGLDVDEEEDEGLFEDADGTKWQVTEGRGLLTGLEDKLDDLKALYKRTFGMDLDEEEDESLFEDADGTKWQVTEGRGPFVALEERLEDLKDLYKCKYGLDVDEEEFFDGPLVEDEDGTKWIATEGRGTLAGLEDRLDDLKALYEMRFGADSEEDEEDDDAANVHTDQDGTKWIVADGQGPLAGLEERLDDLKSLYKKKYGVDVDADDLDEGFGRSAFGFWPAQPTDDVPETVAVLDEGLKADGRQGDCGCVVA